MRATPTTCPRTREVGCGASWRGGIGLNKGPFLGEARDWVTVRPSREPTVGVSSRQNRFRASDDITFAPPVHEHCSLKPTDTSAGSAEITSSARVCITRARAQCARSREAAPNVHARPRTVAHG